MLGAVTRQTFVTWELMTHRAASIMYELWIGDQFEQLFSSDIGLNDLSREFRNRILQLMDSHNVMYELARRLLDRLQDLLWVQIVEELINARFCEINDMGRFEVAGLGRNLRVSFTGSQVLTEEKVPYIRYKAKSVRGVSLHMCQEELIPHLWRSLQEKPLSAAPNVQVLAEALPIVLARYRNHPEVVAMEKERKQEEGQRADYEWLVLQVRPTVHATFYTYLVDFTNILHGGSKKEIQAIGSFELKGGRINFTSAPGLLNILSANMPQATSAGA